jgi:hypothetical protein
MIHPSSKLQAPNPNGLILISAFSFLISAFAQQQMMLSAPQLAPATSSWTNVVNGLLAEWFTNGVSGTDFSGNGNTVTFVGGPSAYSGAPVGNGVTFNGSSQYATTALSSLQAFSYTAWINVASTTGPYGIFGTLDNSGPELQLYTGTLRLLQESIALVSSSSGSVTASAWHFVAVTYDASGNCVFYIDGAAAGSGTNLQSFYSNPIYLGANGNNGSIAEFFSGGLNDVRIYNRALSATEINDLYNWR